MNVVCPRRHWSDLAYRPASGAARAWRHAPEQPGARLALRYAYRFARRDGLAPAAARNVILLALTAGLYASHASSRLNGLAALRPVAVPS